MSCRHRGQALRDTAKRRPAVVVFTETFYRITDAIGRKHQTKTSPRVKKEAPGALNVRLCRS
jgi:predicted GIY-YIG superfamily endonuclease